MATPAVEQPGQQASSVKFLLRSVLVWMPAFVLGIVLVVLVVNLASRGGRAGEQKSPLAPAFELPLFEGGRFLLNDYQGQGVVINFWASWCGPCREEAPVLEAGWRAYWDQGVVFIGVNTWDSEENALAFLHEFEITYANGPDSDGEIATRYRIRGLPMTFFVTPEGRIHHAHLGALTEERLKEAVEVIRP